MHRVNKVDVVRPKVPVPQDRLLKYFRGKLGQSLYVEPVEFDTSDKDMDVTCGSYNSLHDPHLKNFFNKPKRKEHLFKQGLITQDDQVLCSKKELNQYVRYIRRVQHEWDKLFQQEQKKLLKKLMVLKLDGEVPENISTAHLKDLLIQRGRTTFRKIYKKIIKQGSNLDHAEMAWEVTQRIQLDELEKEVLREIRIERRIPPMDVQSGVKNLEEISEPFCSPESTSMATDDQARETLLPKSASSSIMTSSNDGVNSPPLLTTAEKLVLDVLNCSVSLTCSNKADDFKNSDLDHEPPSPSVSPVSSPEHISERNVTKPQEETRSTIQLFNPEDCEIKSLESRPGRMCPSGTSPTTCEKHVQIDIPSEHVVGHALDTVISVLEYEGLLPLQESNKSVVSDVLACSGTVSKIQSPTQSLCSGSSSQLSLEAIKVVSQTLVDLQKKLSDEAVIRAYSPENTDAINELISGILKQVQESPSLKGNRLILSRSSCSDDQSGSDSELGDEDADAISSWFLEKFDIFKSCSDDQNWLELLTETHLDLWLRALIAEEVMKLRSPSQTEAENESAKDTPLNTSDNPDENPTGTKQKKKKERNFFRRAWKALKRTFARRSNKIHPI